MHLLKLPKLMEENIIHTLLLKKQIKKKMVHGMLSQTKEILMPRLLLMLEDYGQEKLEI